MIRTVKLLISGRVQGVFFRKFTKQKANELDIFGTVRNLDDGSVEVIAQAEADKLEAFIQWCHKGPITARVDKVDMVEPAGTDDIFNSFEIV
jgi:acylphosphatase